MPTNTPIPDAAPITNLTATIEGFIVRITVEGTFSEPCARLASIDTGQANRTIEVDIIERVPEGDCDENEPDTFSETVQVNLTGEEPGEYTIQAGDQSTTVELTGVDLPNPREDGPEGAGEPIPVSDLTVAQTTDTTIEVTISGTLRDGCTFGFGAAVERDGTTITLTPTRSIPADTVCTMAMTEYSFTYTIEELDPSTTYTIIIPEGGEVEATTDG